VLWYVGARLAGVRRDVKPNRTGNCETDLMIPLSDHNPTHVAPVVTYGILALCVAAFLYQAGLGMEGMQQLVEQYGAIPARLTGAWLGQEWAAQQDWFMPVWVTLLTCMFLHGDVAHLAGNMLYLWVFGDNIEHALGRVKFVIFYTIGGLVATFSHMLLDPFAEIPMIGASGAISALLGAYLVLYPRQWITVAMPYVGVTQAPAWVVLGLWFGYQFLHGVLVDTSGGGVAFWAHIGGFVAGVALIMLFGPNATQQRPQRPQLWRR
jgi:membrane associated rhomboid family serine protease